MALSVSRVKSFFLGDAVERDYYKGKKLKHKAQSKMYKSQNLQRSDFEATYAQKRISYPRQSISTQSTSRRKTLLYSSLGLSLLNYPKKSWAKTPEDDRPKFTKLDSGITVLLLRDGSKGEIPIEGDKVAIQYYARLAAKQGWRFDSSYTNLDKFGDPIPYEFRVGDGSVIKGLDLVVREMKPGALVRVVIPGYLGYTDRQVGPVPRDFSDRQRLYGTIFNPTRIANGEGDTLGTVIFDVELVAVRK